ncbi:hypothetical protein RHECNPAF_14009 [Rhizobium etli CNPAF512]|nr:hypothetical protein RHECNPAF_14009 [Rhizobium etli CNPAF512]
MCLGDLGGRGPFEKVPVHEDGHRASSQIRRVQETALYDLDAFPSTFGTIKRAHRGMLLAKSNALLHLR